MSTTHLNEPDVEYARSEPERRPIRVRALGKLTKNGNSITVAVPRHLLYRLGWSRGMQVLLDVREGWLVVAKLEDALVSRAVDDGDREVDDERA